MFFKETKNFHSLSSFYWVYYIFMYIYIFIYICWSLLKVINNFDIINYIIKFKKKKSLILDFHIGSSKNPRLKWISFHYCEFLLNGIQRAGPDVFPLRFPPNHICTIIRITHNTCIIYMILYKKNYYKLITYGCIWSCSKVIFFLCTKG